eukprot:1195872-Prorocentrum_minimum.AAC.2
MDLTTTHGGNDTPRVGGGGKGGTGTFAPECKIAISDAKRVLTCGLRLGRGTGVDGGWVVGIEESLGRWRDGYWELFRAAGMDECVITPGCMSTTGREQGDSTNVNASTLNRSPSWPGGKTFTFQNGSTKQVRLNH